jgi:DNA-binding transcriptional LysR family regulator
MDRNASLRTAIAGITLRQLQYFVAVAEEEHFTRAAERLVIAQPALSRQVSDLEEVLGVELFVRASRGVRLTEAGRELLVRTRAMFAVLERTVDAVRFAGHAEFGRLRLGYYGPSFYNNAVTRTALERFRLAFPDVDVVAHELFSEQLIRALHDGRVDVGISRGIVRAADIESRVIATERAVVLVAASDPLANQPVVTMADLDGRAVIVFPNDLSTGLNERIAEMAHEAGITLRYTQELTQLPSIAYHVARNDGIAILPASSGGIAFPGIVAREISDPCATFDLTVVTRRNEESAIALRFLSLLDAPAGDVEEAGPHG